MKDCASNLVACFAALLAAQPAIVTQQTILAGTLLAISSLFLGRAFARRTK
jgi:hypothetical protein